MKAIRIHETGGPEVLQYEEAPDPVAGDDEVLVRVKAVGVNFADHLMRIGAYGENALPLIPGLEAAGIVEDTGRGVSGIERGQNVLAWGRHSYAQYATAPSWGVRPAPDSLSFEQAAAIPVAFGTAWHALVTLAQVRAGERVLAHAAGSGVGSAALLLAKRLGCWVLATAGQDWKLERARELGADAVINYATQDVASELRRLTDGQGVHVALEGVGRTTFAASLSSLAEGGRLVIYGAPSGPRVELDTRLAIFRNLTLLGMSITTSPRFPESVDAFTSQVLPWFEDGQLSPVVDSVYPLAEAGEAHRKLMDRAQFGKLILTVD